jgi:hypothetical protein
MIFIDGQFVDTENKIKKGSVKRKNCKRCEQDLPENKAFFAIKRVTKSNDNTTEWLSNTCKACEKEATRVTEKLKKSFQGLKGDCCHCCEKPTDKLSLDHDYKTGKFRGWICDNCNTGLGRFGDSLEGVEMAVKYLKRDPLAKK